MRRILIRAANVLLLAGCAFVTAGIGNQWVAQSLQPAVTAAQRLEAPAPAGPRPWSDRQRILDRNLFGAQLEGEAPPVEEITEDIEETKLPLKLIGTIAGPKEVARAAIQDVRARKSEVVRPGDTLASHPRVRIDRIDRGRVLLMNQGRREELLLEEVEALVASRPEPRPVRADRRRRRPAPEPNAAVERARIRAQAASEAAHIEEVERRLAELTDLIESGEITDAEAREAMREIDAATP